MGIFGDMHRKHGHRKDKVIQELLEIIQKMEDNERLQNIQLLKEQNENRRLFRELQKCLHKPKPHPVHLDVVF